MSGNEYINLIGENLLKSFDNVYLIDVIKDTIYNYNIEDNYVKLKGSESFLGFLDKEKLLVSEESIDNYTNVLSGNFEDVVSMTYKKNDNYVTSEFCLIAKKLNYENSELIFVMNSRSTNLSVSNNGLSDEEKRVIGDISNVILKIYNAIDADDKENSGYVYIRGLLEDLTSSHEILSSKLEKSIYNEASKGKNSLLIVDDDIITRNILKKAFENDFNIETASNGKEAIELLDNNYKNSSEVLNFVGIFLDIAMPVLDGFAVLEYLKNNGLINAMPVIIISAAEDKETRQRVYSYNIADMLEKPFNLEIIRLRINSFINLYKNSNNLTNLIINKDKDVNQILKVIEESYFYDNKEVIYLVSNYAKILATKYLEEYPSCGLNPSLINKLYEASKYFNIGKCLVPDKVKHKQDLGVEEESMYHAHATNGAILVKRLLMNTNDNMLAEYAYNIALSHHENYDGSGYPNRLSGNNIPLYVQIASLAIMYKKYYLEKLNHETIAANIIGLEGKCFSSELINVFREVLSEFSRVSDENDKEVNQ
jgi:putative two-component system response regulator